MPRFEDIPQFTRDSNYSVHVGWNQLESSLKTFASGTTLDMDPDFQRAHVWTEGQQSRFVEFVLRGGKSAQDIYWNCPTWHCVGTHKSEQPVVLVDGKQRLEAARKFMRNELKAFGSYFKDYSDSFRITSVRFVFNVNDLQTRQEVLQWYLDFNAGGIAHTAHELGRVRKLLDAELENKNCGATLEVE